MTEVDNIDIVLYHYLQALSTSGLQKQVLFSIALVLFVFIMGINILLNVVLKGGKRDE